MPTERCKAAFDYLTKNNRWYAKFLELQRGRIRDGSALSISSYDLFITFTGVECAIYPALYPVGEMSDTGFRNVYVDNSGDCPPHSCGKNKKTSVFYFFAVSVQSYLSLTFQS